MTWYFVALVAALALIGARVVVKLRVAGKSRSESWDEQLIARPCHSGSDRHFPRVMSRRA